MIQRHSDYRQLIFPPLPTPASIFSINGNYFLKYRRIEYQFTGKLCQIISFSWKGVLYRTTIENHNVLDLILLLKNL